MVDKDKKLPQPTNPGETQKDPEIVKQIEETKLGFISTLAKTLGSRLTRTMLFLTLGAMAGPTLTSCDPSEPNGTEEVELPPIDYETAEPMKRVRHKEWQIDVYRQSKVKIHARYGSTLWHFIDRSLRDQGLLPAATPRVDKNMIIDAIIKFCREANPEIDLDQFNSFNGTEINFPSDMIVKPVLNGPSSYPDMWKFARMDGYDVKNGDQQANYDRAIQGCVDMAETGKGFWRSKEDKKSRACMAPDAYKRFQAALAEFHEKSEGWTVGFWNVMRDPERQKAIGSIEATTHTTGRSADIFESHFITPDGVEITWSNNPEYKEKIEKGIQPVLQGVLLKHGIMVYPETGHFHVYIPSYQTVEFRFPKYSSEKVVVQSELDDALFKSMHEMASARSADTSYYSSGKIDREMGEIDAEMQKHGISNYHDLLMQGANGGHPDLYQKLVNSINHMSPEDIARHRIFRGTVFDFQDFQFYDLAKIWETKKAKKSRSTDDELYGYVAADLAGRSNLITFREWLETQQSAVELFKKHGVEVLGFRPEVVQYMSPAVALSVIQAEFNAEFSGETFLDVAPSMFQGVNLPFGPAVNDTWFSAGTVQMIRPTGEGLIKVYYDGLTSIKNSGDDTGYHFVIPNARNIERDKNSGKITSMDLDPKEFTQAILTDFSSQLFYSTLAIADHVQPAFEVLLSDKQGRTAWDNASEQEKYRFMASLAAAAINEGGGRIIETMGRIIDSEHSADLSLYTIKIQEKAALSTSRRGGKVGLGTMNALLEETGMGPLIIPPEERRKDEENPWGSWIVTRGGGRGGIQTESGMQVQIFGGTSEDDNESQKVTGGEGSDPQVKKKHSESQEGSDVQQPANEAEKPPNETTKQEEDTQGKKETPAGESQVKSKPSKKKPAPARQLPKPSRPAKGLSRPAKGQSRPAQ
jgi:hypothetical protein